MKGSFVKQQEFRVHLSKVQLALREMAEDLHDRKIWLTIGGIVLLVAMAGPFYTLESLGLAGRIAYWGSVGMTSWLMMWALNRITFALTPAHWPRVLIGALAGCAGILPVMGMVALANLTAGMNLPAYGFWGFAPYVAPPVIGISVLAALLIPEHDKPEPPVDGNAQSGLFSRLPPELGHNIVALQAQDHYVHVTTTKGSILILMRMSDAVSGLASLDGLQIHRSWWINLRHVTQLKKLETGRVELVLDNRVTVPVPRSRQSEIKTAISAYRSTAR